MVRLVNSVVLVLPRGLELGLGLKTYMCTVCTISSFLLLFVVSIIGLTKIITRVANIVHDW